MPAANLGPAGLPQVRVPQGSRHPTLHWDLEALPAQEQLDPWSLQGAKWHLEKKVQGERGRGFTQPSSEASNYAIKCRFWTRLKGKIFSFLMQAWIVSSICMLSP